MLVVSGRAASYGTFTLRKPCLLRLDQMATEGGRNYVGIYLRRTDAPGDLGEVRFPQLDQSGLSRFQMQWGSLAQPLPVGQYAAYLVADSAATVSIPIQADQNGSAPTITVHATRTTSLAVHVQSAPLSFGQTNASIRTAPAFNSRTAGAIGAYFGSQTNLSGVRVSACLPRHDQPCAARDPQAHGNTQIAVGGYVGATLDVTPGSVQELRDELGSATAPATTSGTLYLISIAVPLG
jgi:hypothetical protein